MALFFTKESDSVMIGKKMAYLRKQKGMRQADLAAAINVSIDTIRRWEQGKRDPNADDLVKLATTFDTKVSYLIGEIEELKALENVRATATNNSIANVNGTVNSTDRNIIFEYEKGENKMRLVFPHETPGDTIAQIVNATLMRHTT
jgi:transcriptional regulator with XRE-family HTH domain